MIDHRFISHLFILILIIPSLLSSLLSLPEVSGDSDPWYGAPPSLHDAGEKAGGSGSTTTTTTTTVSPEAHRSPAPPAAPYSCCSVSDPDQLGLSTPSGQNQVGSELLAPLAASLSGEPQRRSSLHLQLPQPGQKILFLSMAESPQARVGVLLLVLPLLGLAPAPVLGGCPSSCRCSFAMIQCLEADGITSIPTLSPQESENVTEM